jgi:ankyrin repeat protein
MEPAHTILAQACLGVLLHLDESVTEDSLEEFPLAEYAAEHWVGHGQFENVLSNVQDGMKQLFDPNKGHLSVCVWIHDPDDPWRRSERSERSLEPRATHLHYAALYGLHEVAAFLIGEHSQEINARGLENEETALHVASRRGHLDVARLLLENGADTEAKDNEEHTALLWASRGGHVDVVRVLLEHGADVETRDDFDVSPLERATIEGEGHLDVVRVLLEHGADATALNSENLTPLHYARGGQVARLLLKLGGADPNILDSNDRTPLHQASELGHVGTARVLLEYGVDVNARDADNATPLHLASAPTYIDEEHPDVVRLLLQHGADFRALDGEGWTPLMRATAEEHRELIQILSEYGAKV